MNPDDEAVRAASAAVDARCAENSGEWPADWLVERSQLPSFSDLAVAYTTVRDQALAIIGESDELQQCVVDLVAAGADEDAARSAIATVVEYALTKGIIRVQ